MRRLPERENSYGRTGMRWEVDTLKRHSVVRRGRTREDPQKSKRDCRNTRLFSLTRREIASDLDEIGATKFGLKAWKWITD